MDTFLKRQFFQSTPPWVYEMDLSKLPPFHLNLPSWSWWRTKKSGSLLIIVHFMTPISPLSTPASWGKLMRNKKNNSASTFADALEAMNDATGNGTGENEMLEYAPFFWTFLEIENLRLWWRQCKSRRSQGSPSKVGGKLTLIFISI